MFVALPCFVVMQQSDYLIIGTFLRDVPYRGMILCISPAYLTLVPVFSYTSTIHHPNIPSRHAPKPTITALPCTNDTQGKRRV